MLLGFLFANTLDIKDMKAIQDAAALSALAREFYYPGKRRDDALKFLKAKFGDGHWIELRTGHGKSVGFLGYDYRKKEFIFAARGTLDLWDAKIDLQNWSTKLQTQKGVPFEIHTGFYKRFCTLSVPIPAFVTRMLQSYNVQIDQTTLLSVGHSLGGSLAQLVAVFLKHPLTGASNNFKKVTLITFGAPAVGKGEGWKQINAGVDEIRVVSPKDLIPNITSYQHIRPPSYSIDYQQLVGSHKLEDVHARLANETVQKFYS